MSIILHWLGAIAIIAMLVTAAGVFLAPNDEIAGARIEFHASTGMLLYVLIAIRILWSWFETKPNPLQPDRKLTVVIRIVHSALLLLIALQLITGPLDVWSGGWPVSAFGIYTFASPFDGPRPWHNLIGDVHSFTGLAIASLVTVHILAAFKHHFINRDRTLPRMLGKSK
ncbi:cytochrome b [Novosphingobium profundi]|uniref:cytochrome b n=1 Tax=Novosphingobium profundi TaxID=1774954 RepID=UPI00299D84CF|nr:cytochrome b/b6 domain-containing protein [Novosphingobium profundi]